MKKAYGKPGIFRVRGFLLQSQPGFRTLEKRLGSSPSTFAARGHFSQGDSVRGWSLHRDFEKAHKVSTKSNRNVPPTFRCFKFDYAYGSTKRDSEGRRQRLVTPFVPQTLHERVTLPVSCPGRERSAEYLRAASKKTALCRKWNNSDSLG